MTNSRLQQMCRNTLSHGYRAFLTQSGLIKISGQDARAFCHRMFSNEIEGLKQTKATVAAWCQPNGHVEALFRMFYHQDAFFLSMHQNCIDNLVRRLRLYVLRDDVTIEDVSRDYLCIGLGGEIATNVLAGFFSMLPDLPNMQAYTYGANLIRLADAFGAVRFLMVVPEAQRNLWTNHLVSLTAVDDNAWLLSEIDAGFPVITAPTPFIPQMLCLEENSGLSYKKGCFPGQEVIARARYRGVIRRHLAHYTCTGTQMPSFKDPILNAQGEIAGDVLCCAQDGENVSLLAVISIAAQNEALTCHGAALTHIALPYAYAETIEAGK